VSKAPPRLTTHADVVMSKAVLRASAMGTGMPELAVEQAAVLGSVEIYVSE